LKVSYARPSSDTIKGANLYICGLRLDINQRELENMFSKFGTIISSKLLTEIKPGNIFNSLQKNIKNSFD
jgi:RNA recognition motif-containing protein